MTSDANSRLFGVHVLRASRIAGFIGVGVGILTFIVAIFLDTTLGSYLDGLITVIIYGILIGAYHSNDHRWYMVFFLANATLILLKFLYLLILTIMVVVTPTWSSQAGYMYPGQFPGQQTYRYAGSTEPIDPSRARSPLGDTLSGVLGTVNFNSDIGSESLGDTVQGVLGTVKFDRDREHYNPNSNYGYRRPYGESARFAFSAIILLFVAITLVFNCFVEFIAYRAYQYLHPDAVDSENGSGKLDPERRIFRTNPKEMSPPRNEKEYSIPIRTPVNTSPINPVATTNGGRLSASSGSDARVSPQVRRISISTEV
ncbi:hypothetical protein Ddc_18624 [Ditylenchus destructor]|nr:hypothetical protein Ddc_18624 [Ditylenchus destructor]